MTNHIDQLNYYDPLIRGKSDKMSEDWIANLSAFIQTLQGYLSEFGDFIPVLTMAERNSIQTPQEGQLIYVKDAVIGPPRTAQLQIWQVVADVGQWTTIV
jgi:hypothetical protein